MYGSIYQWKCANYTKVSILCVLGKIYGKGLINRVMENAKEYIAEEKENLCLVVGDQILS